VDRVMCKKSRATSLCSKQNWMYLEELPNIENLNISASFRATTSRVVQANPEIG